MLGALIRVARPDDWTGTAARLVVGLIGFWFLVYGLVGSLPAAWTELALGNTWFARAAFLAVALYVLSWLRLLSIAVLPRAPVLVGRTLRFRRRGRRIALDVHDVVHVDVELRPSPVGETFVLEMADGQVLDLCPVHWQGAERLFARISRQVARRARRRAK